LQRKYYETKQGIPIYFRDTAPINFDVSILIKKIDKIDKAFLSNIKKIIFVRQEKLEDKKSSFRRGTVLLSNEVYDIEKCFCSFLKEVSLEYYRKNEQEISSNIRDTYFAKKADLYYGVIVRTNKVPLCDFLYEERSNNFERQIEKVDEEVLAKQIKRHFLNKDSIMSLEEYFSDCLIGYYQKKKTKLKQTHKKVYKIISKVIEH
jgi:hypothetical protein